MNTMECIKEANKYFLNFSHLKIPLLYVDMKKALKFFLLNLTRNDFKIQLFEPLFLNF